MLGMSWQAMRHSFVPHVVLFSIVNLCASFSSLMQKHTKNSDAMLTNIFSGFRERDYNLKTTIFFLSLLILTLSHSATFDL